MPMRDFTASGRIIRAAGWKELYGADAEEKKDEDEGTLPAMEKGDKADLPPGVAEKKSTRPPGRFTAATLLAAMKEIHKYVKNPELKKQLKDVSGIGTEATRATIIKELIQRGFLREEKKKKYLVPTESAYLLIDALPEELTYPDSTALWEMILHRMADGSESLEGFLKQQAEFTAAICAMATGLNIALQGDHPCPECGKGVLRPRNGKKGKFWGCSRYPACKAAYDDNNGEPQKAEALLSALQRRGAADDKGQERGVLGLQQISRLPGYLQRQGGTTGYAGAAKSTARQVAGRKILLIISESGGRQRDNQ